MTLSFETAFAQSILTNEGGFVSSNLAHDTGAATFAGISRNYHPQWEGWALLDAGISGEHLTDAVKQFYMQEFWSPLQAENLPPRIAGQLFDFAINAGIVPAVKALQRAIGVVDDGNIGAKTIACARNVSPSQFVARFNAQRLRFYTSLDDAWPHFGKGWANRVATELERGSE
jgi:lysozyme family protein